MVTQHLQIPALENTEFHKTEAVFTWLGEGNGCPPIPKSGEVLGGNAIPLSPTSYDVLPVMTDFHSEQC